MVGPPPFTRPQTPQGSRSPPFFERFMREHPSNLEDAEDARTCFTPNDIDATTSAYAHLQQAPGALSEPGYASSLVPGKLFNASKPSAKAQPAQPMHRALEEEGRKEVGEKEEVAEEKGKGDALEKVLAEHPLQQQGQQKPDPKQPDEERLLPKSPVKSGERQVGERPPTHQHAPGRAPRTCFTPNNDLCLCPPPAGPPCLVRAGS